MQERILLSGYCNCTKQQTLDKTTASVYFTGNTLSAGTIRNDSATLRGNNSAAQVGDKLTVTGLETKTYGTDYTITWYRTDKDKLNTLTAKPRFW